MDFRLAATGFALLALTTPSLAQQPSLAQEPLVASTMPCAAAANLVQSKGEVVFSTGQFAFDRAVRENRFCNNDEITSPLYAKTSDQAMCFVGYRCRLWEHGDSKG